MSFHCLELEHLTAATTVVICTITVLWASSEHYLYIIQ